MGGGSHGRPAYAGVHVHACTAYNASRSAFAAYILPPPFLVFSWALSRNLLQGKRRIEIVSGSLRTEARS